VSSVRTLLQGGFTHTIRHQRQRVKRFAWWLVGDADNWQARLWRRVAMHMARRTLAEEGEKTTPWLQHVTMAFGCFVVLWLLGALGFSRLEGWTYFEGIW
jgi:hypothetical protein